MGVRAPLFGGILPPLPRVTRWLLIAYVVLSIVGALGRAWLGLGDVAEWMAFAPALVLRGQVWRLISYPWLANSPLDLVWGCMSMFFFAAPLESSWGRRVFVRRIVLLTVMPPLILTLLSLAIPVLQGTAALGLGTLSLGMLVAWASQLRSNQVHLLFVPVPLTGDAILGITGGFIALSILFSGFGSIPGHMLSVVAFAFGLAWFRLDLFKGLRRSWLRMRKRRLETRVTQLRRERNLRIVRPDEDDEEQSRFLH